VASRKVVKTYQPVPGGVKPPGLLLQEAMEANGATCFWWALTEIVLYGAYMAARPIVLAREQAGVTPMEAVAMSNAANPMFIGIPFNVCHVDADGTLIDTSTQAPWYSQPVAARNDPSNAFVCFVWFDDAGNYDPHWLPFASAKGLKHAHSPEESQMIVDRVRQFAGLPAMVQFGPANRVEWEYGRLGQSRFDWGRHNPGVLARNPPWRRLENCGLVVTNRPVWADPPMDAERIVYTVDPTSTYSAEVDSGVPSSFRRFWRQSIIRQEFGLAEVAWAANSTVLLQAEVRAGDLLFSRFQEWPRSVNELPGGELQLSQLHSLRLSTGVAYPLGTESRFIDATGCVWQVRELLPPITTNFKAILAIFPWFDELVSGFSWNSDREVTVDDYPSPDIYVWTRYRALMLSLPKDEMYLHGMLNRAMESALDNKDYSDPYIVGNQIMVDVRGLMKRQGASVPAYAA
jgi:hypothetical protein